jgi:hypothetical protein
MSPGHKALLKRHVGNVLVIAGGSKLCACVPLIDEQAIEDPIDIAVMKPIRPAKNSLLDEAESFGDGAAELACRSSLPFQSAG